MPKVSVVDISNPDKITEILGGETEEALQESSKSEDEDNESEDEEDGVIPQLLFSVFSTLTILVPLVSVHIALDIIVHQQYAQSVDVVEIAARAATAALRYSYSFRANISPRILNRRSTSTERSPAYSMCFVFCISSTRCSYDTGHTGWRLLRCHGTFTLRWELIKKRAPGIGTLLIFCAVELQIPESLLALALVAIYALWHGEGRLF